MELNPYMQELIERGVSALERLADDPVIQVETMPPVCPHCEKMNPRVRVQESEAEGELAGFVIQAHCLNCNQVFYAIPVQWGMARNTEEAGQIISERAAVSGYNG